MFTGMPATRRREVGAVIEIETAEVVLVGLALPAVLADDHAGHGFQYFTGAHDRAVVDLSRRHHALRRRQGDTDEVFAVGELADIEGALPGHRHISRKRKAQRHVDDLGGAVVDAHTRPAQTAEIRERHFDDEGARRETIESIFAGAIGVRVVDECAGYRAQLHECAWHHGAARIGDHAPDRAAVSSRQRYG